MNDGFEVFMFYMHRRSDAGLEVEDKVCLLATMLQNGDTKS